MPFAIFYWRILFGAVSERTLYNVQTICSETFSVAVSGCGLYYRGEVTLKLTDIFRFGLVHHLEHDLDVHLPFPSLLDVEVRRLVQGEQSRPEGFPGLAVLVQGQEAPRPPVQDLVPEFGRVAFVQGKVHVLQSQLMIVEPIKGGRPIGDHNSQVLTQLAWIIQSNLSGRELPE